MSGWIEGPPQKPGVYECETSIGLGFSAMMHVFFDGQVSRRLDTAIGLAASSITRHRRLEVVPDETPIAATPTPEPFRVTEPGWYRTRCGKKAKVVCMENSDDTDTVYPILGWIDGPARPITWKRSGETVFGQSSPADLVAKWIDEPTTPPKPPALEPFLIVRPIPYSASHERVWVNQECGQYFAFNGEAGERVVFSKDKGWRRVSEKEQP